MRIKTGKRDSYNVKRVSENFMKKKAKFKSREMAKKNKQDMSSQNQEPLFKTLTEWLKQIKKAPIDMLLARGIMIKVS